jgi:rod shape-determining protein MreD
MQLSDSPGSQQILMPVRVGTILGSFALALFLNFLPWRNVALVPDFVALVLAFWCIRQPRLVGLGAGWLLGLLTDAGNGVLLGQHALAYSLLAFAAISLSRRILWFPLWGQALHVAALLLFAQGVAALVRVAAGADVPGWSIVIGPLIGAALWPLVTLLLLLPQRRPAEPDSTRPI